jgi:hypothetical protein
LMKNPDNRFSVPIFGIKWLISPFEGSRASVEELKS